MNKPRSVAEIEQELAEARKLELKKFDDYEALKNAAILALNKRAVEVSEILKEFKIYAFSEVGAVQETLKELSGRQRDGKGNFRIMHGDMRITFRKQGKVTFDEKSTEAEAYIKEFVEAKFENDIDTKDLIVSLLERKNEEFDISLIQRLYKMEDRFDDENWRKGIRLLRQSYNYTHSKDYITFEKRDSEGKWKQILLNFASV